MHIWLHHCTLCASAERDGQEVVGGVARRVTYTWWLLGLTVKGPWLGLGRPPLPLTAWKGLETLLTLWELGGLVSGKEGCLHLIWCMTTQSANYYMLVNEWTWLL